MTKKKFISLLPLCIIISLFSACNQPESIEVNTTAKVEQVDANSTVSKESLEKSTPEHLENAISTENITETTQSIVSVIPENSEMEPDPYVGEYNCYDIHEPYLEIQKNEDNTYEIQIDIFRLLLLDDCVGHATAEVFNNQVYRYGNDRTHYLRRQR